MPGGTEPASVGTLEECHAACIDDKTCVAIVWKETAKSCLTHDKTADTEDETGTKLYYLNRRCLGWSPSLLLVIILCSFKILSFYPYRPNIWVKIYVLFCSLAVLDPRVGHTPWTYFLYFISVLCRSD